MLCDSCQEREATVHTTHCSNIAGDVPRQQHLCGECFEASNPTQARELAEALQAGCRYCGGEPYSGGNHSPGGLSGTMKLSFKCKPCAEEYFRFLRQKLPGFGEPDITTGQIAEMRTRNIAGVLTERRAHEELGSGKRFTMTSCNKFALQPQLSELGTSERFASRTATA